MNNVRDFGAKGDGTTLDTEAIQKAIDAGGMVYFPPGVYLSGTLYLKSDGGLDLSPGALLLASPDRKDYNADDFCEQNRVFASEQVSGAHFIVAVEQHNLTIRGGGRIDGNRKAFYDIPGDRYLRPEEYPLWRPGQMIYLCECENVTIADVELRNAPYWTCFLHGCERLTIHGLRIYNNRHTLHGDGLDIDSCRFATVSDCIIESGDDCITLRGFDEPLKRKKPCEFITITNCILSTKCNAFRVGVGSGLIRNCTISNIIIQNTRTGIQMVSRYNSIFPGAGIENIHFSDIFFQCRRPLSILSDVRGPHDEAPRPIRNLSFRNLHGFADWSNLIESNRRGDIRNLRFSEISFEYSGGGDCEEGENLIYGEFGVKNAPAAFHLSNMEDVTFSDVEIRWNTDCPAWKYGILAKNSELPEIRDCRFGKSNSINGEITQ